MKIRYYFFLVKIWLIKYSFSVLGVEHIFYEFFNELEANQMVKKNVCQKAMPYKSMRKFWFVISSVFTFKEKR